MSRQRGQKTPARVQVFFFEKKKTGRPTSAADPDDSATTLPKQEKRRLTAEQAQRRANARTASHRAARAITRSPDLSRRTTEKVLAAASLHEHPTEPETPSVGVPPAGPRNSAMEALEYHKLKLQELAAHGRAPRAAANLALYGHALYARGRLDEARLVFESLVSREPEEAFAYTMLGAIYLAQDDDSRALALFDAALTIEESDLAALVGRGEIRLRRGQPKQALQDLERAIAGDPSGRDPFSERARALSVLARTLARTLR